MSETRQLICFFLLFSVWLLQVGELFSPSRRLPVSSCEARLASITPAPWEGKGTIPEPITEDEIWRGGFDYATTE